MTDAPPKPEKPKKRHRAETTVAGGIPLAGPVEYWPTSKLTPYARNPRTHTPDQVREIASSILEFGFRNPILVKGTTVRAGHGRLLAAQKLGLQKVPVIRLDDLSETQARAYVLADNQLALKAGWDNKLLVDELCSLERESFDLGVTGFSSQQLQEMSADLARAAAAATSEAKRRGRPAGRILQMLEFDTHDQKERWLEFRAWLMERAPGKSFAAALDAHVAAAMTRRGR